MSHFLEIMTASVFSAVYGTVHYKEPLKSLG